MQRGSYYWFRENSLRTELEFAKPTTLLATMAGFCPQMQQEAAPCPVSGRRQHYTKINELI
jgi:hypothetical protein